MPDYAAQFRACAATANRLLDGLSEQQFVWRPREDGWSIGDCLAHLVATADAYLPALRSAVERAREKGWRGSPPFRLGWFGGWFARYMEPPPTRALRVPRVFAPSRAVALEGTRTAYFERNGWLTALVADAKGLDLARAKISSPVTRLIRFNLAAAFAVVAAHERRHLWQAGRVRESPDFPESA